MKVEAMGGDGKVGFDLISVGAPLMVGPELQVASIKAENTSFSEPSDYVFAYQLVKISSRRNKKHLVKDHNKGALFNTGTHTEVTASADEIHEDWDIETPELVPLETLAASAIDAVDELDDKGRIVISTEL